MAAVDRTKYMSIEEVKQLRTVTEARAIVDLRAGRVNGPLAWMLVDVALSTGLRVSEIAALNVEDIDRKRGCMSVTRLKHRKPRQGDPGYRQESGRPPQGLPDVEVGPCQ